MELIYNVEYCLGYLLVEKGVLNQSPEAGVPGPVASEEKCLTLGDLHRVTGRVLVTPPLASTPVDLEMMLSALVYHYPEVRRKATTLAGETT